MTDVNEQIGAVVPPTPLSHLVNVLKLPGKGQIVKLAPDAEKRAGLAVHLDILSIDYLEAIVTVKRWHKDGVRIEGTLKATLNQACVTTLEPVTEQIDEMINAVFVPEGSKLAKPNLSSDGQELLIDAQGDDAPELFALPFLDVGDVIAEFLALSLDLYPRAQSAQNQTAEPLFEGTDESNDGTENPFGALAALKNKL